MTVLMRRRLRHGPVLIGLALFPLTVQAQEACHLIDAVVLQCPDLETIAGVPPFCFCDGRQIETLELSCAANFGCPSGDEVGTGTWPDCVCTASAGEGGSGTEGSGQGPEGPQPGTGLGGVETCQQFFDCPTGSVMAVNDGACSCDAVMLPQFKD